jgi:outer membrane protein insertion porin family
MKRLVVTFLFIALSLQAATLKSLKFDGLIHISDEVAAEMIGMKIGDSVDIEIIDEAIKTLYKQKYFEDIWAEDVGDGEIIFHFKEKPTVANIELEGIGENDKKEVHSFIGMKKGEVFDKEKAHAAAGRIAKYYEGKGYFDTVVEYKTEVLNENSIAVKFLINRGEEIIIKSVRLSGASELEYSDFQPTIANKEAEMIPWMWGFNDGKLRLSDLEYDNARIKDVYMQNGFLDAEVGTSFLKAYLDSYTADLTYQVQEGKQYKIGLVDITIPEGLVSVEELKAEMILQVGDVFNINRLRRDIKRVETKVADLGYAYVRVIPAINKKTEESLADITLRVIPGDKVYINDVRISGNSRTIDRVVRRDVFLAAGDLYSRTDLGDSKSALKRSSYFKDVSIEEKRISKDKIDLVVEVKEASTGSVGGGLGYGSSDGLLLSANLSDSNIFGSGMSSSVNIERSNKVLSGSISLTNPRIFDSLYSVGGSLYSADSNYYNYDALSTGLALNVGKRFGRHWRGSLGYNLEKATYSNPAPGFTLPGDGIKSSVTPSISYNTTDDYYLPRRGIDFKSSVEFAGLGGDRKFIKNSNKFNYFYGLKDDFNYDLILRYKAQVDYAIGHDNIKEFPKEFPTNERIFMGGVGSVRGYQSRSISPKDTSGNLQGGNMMVINTVEASFPLIERLKMRGALFLDYGMMGQDNLDIKRAGTGAVLEWISPLGPISLVFSHALLDETGDRTASFEFTMGRQF